MLKFFDRKIFSKFHLAGVLVAFLISGVFYHAGFFDSDGKKTAISRPINSQFLMSNAGAVNPAQNSTGGGTSAVTEILSGTLDPSSQEVKASGLNTDFSSVFVEGSAVSLAGKSATELVAILEKLIAEKEQIENDITTSENNAQIAETLGVGDVSEVFVQVKEFIDSIDLSSADLSEISSASDSTAGGLKASATEKTSSPADSDSGAVKIAAATTAGGAAVAAASTGVGNAGSDEISTEKAERKKELESTGPQKYIFEFKGEVNDGFIEAMNEYLSRQAETKSGIAGGGMLVVETTIEKSDLIQMMQEKTGSRLQEGEVYSKTLSSGIAEVTPFTLAATAVAVTSVEPAGDMSEDHLAAAQVNNSRLTVSQIYNNVFEASGSQQGDELTIELMARFDQAQKPFSGDDLLDSLLANGREEKILNAWSTAFGNEDVFDSVDGYSLSVEIMLVTASAYEVRYTFFGPSVVSGSFPIGSAIPEDSMAKGVISAISTDLTALPK